MAKSTQRINLGKPYEDYINTLVESGYYASATEVIRDALRLKMNNKDEHRKAVIYKMVEQAQESIKEGDSYTVDENYWSEFEKRHQKKAEDSLKVKSSV
jgi:antitoxin ParD1/3/4